MPGSVADAEGADLTAAELWVGTRRRGVTKARAAAEVLDRDLRELWMGVTAATLNLQQEALRPFIGAEQEAIEADKALFQAWQTMLAACSHDRGLWRQRIDKRRVVSLDPTEGPHRMRVRCSSVFTDTIYPGEETMYTGEDDPRLAANDLASLLFEEEVSESLQATSNVLPNERLQFVCECVHVTPYHRRTGEFVVGEEAAYFFADVDSSSEARKKRRRKKLVVRPRFVFENNIVWGYAEIREIHRRRHLLQNNALEVFLTSGRTYLFSFGSTEVGGGWGRQKKGVGVCCAGFGVGGACRLWNAITVAVF